MKVLITVPVCPLLERPDFRAPLSDEALTRLRNKFVAPNP